MPKVRRPGFTHMASIINSTDRTPRREAWKVLTQADPSLRHAPVVYYLRFDRLVKIGTTGNIHQRMTQIQNEGLLAVEYGSVTLERERHRQFTSSHYTGEWFTLDEALGAHIVELRSRFEQEQGLTVEAWLDERSRPLKPRVSLESIHDLLPDGHELSE